MRHTRTAHLPVLIAIVFLAAGCDGGTVASVGNAIAAGQYERAAGDIACQTQQQVERNAEIGIRGTEAVVVATGVMTRTEIADARAQVEQAARQPIAMASAAASRIDCRELGRQVAQIGAAAAQASR